MAVIQISKIQVRRGERLQLPGAPTTPGNPSTLTAGLDVGEFGFATDTNQLFIGTDTSGPTAARTTFPYQNVEVLTEFSANIETLLKYQYQYRIGGAPSASPLDNAGTPILRNLQDRLDEAVSVKSYGAVGDGVNDDTYAIVRAALDVAQTNTGYLRALYFPAGTYRTTYPVPLPQGARWIGDGKGRSIILLDDTARPCVVSTVSPTITVSHIGNLDDYKSVWQTGINPLDGSKFPELSNITVEGLTFSHASATDDVLWLYRSSNVLFRDCEFVTAWSCADLAGANNACVRIEGFSTVVPQNISFTGCTFRRAAYAMQLATHVRQISIADSLFTSLRRGLELGAASPTDDGPESIRVALCTFATIKQQAIFVYPSQNASLVQGVVSTSNRFLSVGDGLNSDCTSANTPATPIIEFSTGCSGCVSAGDTFTRTVADAATARVSFSPNDKVVVVNPQDAVSLGIASSFTKVSLPGSITSATTTGIGFSTDIANTYLVDYSIIEQNVGNPLMRVGRLRIFTNVSSSTVTITDDNDESGTIPVTFSAQITDSNHFSLYYTNTGSNSINLYYKIIEQWTSSSS